MMSIGSQAVTCGCSQGWSGFDVQQLICCVKAHNVIIYTCCTPPYSGHIDSVVTTEKLPQNKSVQFIYFDIR